MIQLQHPATGVIVSVTPEKAERLGWPQAGESPTVADEPALETAEEPPAEPDETVEEGPDGDPAEEPPAADPSPRPSRRKTAK